MSYILLVTEKCSARCTHCPYSYGKDIDIDVLLKKIDSIQDEFIIVTGGEPLEHRNIHRLIFMLSNSGKKFRLCTGGHIILTKIMPFLFDLSGFSGISLGTDILIPSRNTNVVLKKNWLKNIEIMNDWRVNYSLTITIDSSVNFDYMFYALTESKINPDFIMINDFCGKLESMCFRNLMLHNIENIYPNVEILYGYKN